MFISHHAENKILKELRKIENPVDCKIGILRA